MKQITPDEIASLIPDNVGIATSGFIGCAFPEMLAICIEESFLEKGKPNNLSIFFAAGQGDSKDKGLNHLGHEGLLRFALGSHFGLLPKIVELIVNNKIEAYAFPQGIMTHLFRAASAKAPCVISKVGLGTFVDPRVNSGSLNDISKSKFVELFKIGNEEYLQYSSKPFEKIKIALLRGTTSDELGNITMEKEGLTGEVLQVATMVHNNGGRVLVQVERITEAKTLHPQMVKLPGHLVDYVIVCDDQWQTFGEKYNPGYSGEIRIPVTSFTPIPLDVKKVIGRRASKELKKGMIVNIGIGSVPESVASVCAEEGIFKDLILTVEPGPIGGIPATGLSFGASLNPWAIIDQPSQFDFYDGGGLDCTCLGFAEGDEEGNVNVSRFGSKIPGPGGFINISQNAKKVVFCGTFIAGSKIEVKNGKLNIIKDGEIKKFLKHVSHITFSGEYAVKAKQEVLYVTERAVFKLTNEGIELIEYAPGINLEKDIINLMEFTPILKNPQIMDSKIFNE